MKKKLTVATVLVLLLAVCLTMLVGCDQIFTKNEERDYTQVVATVNYEGQTANIYKYELRSSFNNYAYAYHNYYGLSYEQAADYILQSLAQQKLLSLYAREQVAKHLGVANTDIQTLLTSSELNHAIEAVNDSLLTQLKSTVEDSINEDRYNNDEQPTPDKDEDKNETPSEGAKTIRIRFDSNGGSEVERQYIKEGGTVKEPSDPTRSGYTFYGWFNDNAFETEFDFDSTVSDNITLYAKWAEYTAPRTEMPEVEEEEEDYDPDLDDDSVVISPKFFADTDADDENNDEISDAYRKTLYDEFVDEDFVKNMSIPSNSDFEKTLNNYIDDGLATIASNLKANLFKATAKECYDYLLNGQMESAIVEKLQRIINKRVSVGDEKIKDEYDRIIAENQSAFTGTSASSNYSSALTSKLDTTFYHYNTSEIKDSYGFVINILLKLDEKSLEELKNMYTANPSNKAALIIKRNRLISNIEVKISNPEYDSTAKVEKDGKEIELRDPMTDSLNPYNNVGKTPDTAYQKENQAESYNQIISFSDDADGKGNFGIVFNVSEHPSMAYMLETWPAFDKDGKTGIIHQIYNNFDQVKQYVNSGDLTREQGVYWLREVATKWLYLVGDDSGALSDSSNNKGLGYLITPEGQTSGYLGAFTDYARELIKNGTGSYTAGAVDANTFVGASANGNGKIAGDGVAFVVADSFIGTGATDLSSAYAGVFVLLNSYTVWDTVNYDNLPEDGKLPLDYVLTYAKDVDDVKTISDILKESLQSAEESRAYNLEVNTMGVKYMKEVQYFKSAYKSLWKEYEEQ